MSNPSTPSTVPFDDAQDSARDRSAQDKLSNKEHRTEETQRKNVSHEAIRLR